MAERVPVGAARNRKSPPFTSFGLTPSDDVSNASMDRPNGQIVSQEPDMNGLNSQLLSNGSSTTVRNASHNKLSHLEATGRNGSKTKESESNHEAEWVEQDESGLYITLTSLPGGVKDLKRVRFSRKQFSKMQAEKWRAENRARAYEQYNV